MNGEIEALFGSYLVMRLLLTKFCFKKVQLLFYTIWSITSWYAVCELFSGRDTFGIWALPRLLSSISTVYVYELVFHVPDWQHVAHHGFTILLQCLVFYSGFASISIENAVLVSSSYLGLFSSIFSNARHIAKKEDWTNKRIISNAYYYSYLLAKPGMMIAHYSYWYVQRKTIAVQGYQYVHIIYAAIHLIQMYFSWSIVCILKNQYTNRRTNLRSDEILDQASIEKVEQRLQQVCKRAFDRGSKMNEFNSLIRHSNIRCSTAKNVREVVRESPGPLETTETDV